MATLPLRDETENNLTTTTFIYPPYPALKYDLLSISLPSNNLKPPTCVCNLM